MPTFSQNNKLVKMTDAQIMAGLGNTAVESQAKLFAYLKFSGKDGKFTVPDGTDDPAELTNGVELMLNVFDSSKGYVCWKDNVVQDQTEQSIFQPLPEEGENGVPVGLQDHGPYAKKQEGWSKQFTLVFKQLAADGHQQYSFKTNSASGTRSVGALIQDLFNALSQHSLNLETPVIKLKATKFKNKVKNELTGQWEEHTNYKPEFTIVRWEKNPELPAIEGPAETAKQIEGPAASTMEITGEAITAGAAPDVGSGKKKGILGK